ncbi:hypothetical protein FALCPG4_004718 [Fusarium falciforme]
MRPWTMLEGEDIILPRDACCRSKKHDATAAWAEFGDDEASQSGRQRNKVVQNRPKSCSEAARETRNQGGYIVYSACRPETSIRTSFPLTDAQHHLARGKGDGEAQG